MTGETREQDPPSVRFGSWGLLVIEDETARFLWFDGPDEMASSLLDCCERRRPRRSGDGSPTLGEVHGAYRRGKLNVLTLLNRLVDELEATAGPRLILWWGPLYDLAYSYSRVPMAVRTWFRERVKGDRDAARQHGPLESSETDAFAQFVEHISFGVDPFDGSLEAS